MTPFFSSRTLHKSTLLILGGIGCCLQLLIILAYCIGLVVYQVRRSEKETQRKKIVEYRKNMEEYRKNLEKEYSYSLLNNRPYQETTIPFTPREGIIFVPVKIDGKTFEAAFDTGSGYELLWHEKLKLSGEKLVGEYRVPDGGGFHTTIKPVRINSVQLGDYQRKNIRTFSMQKTAKYAPNVIVGNPYFYPIVVTVDYKKSIMTLRNSSYQPIQKERMIALNFRWTSILPCPYIAGVVNGHQANFVVDTGASTPLISERLAGLMGYNIKKLKTSALFPTTFGRSVLPYIPDCKLKIGQTEGHYPMVVIKGLWKEVDGIIGRDFLKNYRFTIDYPRQKIYLEPYEK